jgi:hypothetical protein
MANESVKRSVSVYIDSGNAQQTLDRLIAKEKDLKSALSQASDPKVVKQLNTELSKLQEPLDRATKKVKGELGPSFKDLQNTVTNLSKQLKKMSTEDADYSKTLAQYKAANVELDRQKESLGRIKTAHEETGRSFGDIFKRVAEYTGAFLIIEKLADGVKEFFKGSIEESNKAEEAASTLKNSLENAGRVDLFNTLTEQAEKFHDAYKRINPNDIKDIFSKLVDYGKLSENQISSLTDVIINYAAREKVSLQDATDVFTKAFEGQARSLKKYGVDLSDAHTVSQRFNVIMDQMGQKVKGSELAFEQTSRGWMEVWKEKLVGLEEKVGDFLKKLTGLEEQQFQNAVAAKKEANEGQALLDQYEELSKKVNKTAADKQNLQHVTSELTTIFGNSVLKINAETGAMELNIGATKDLIKQKLLLANGKASEIAAKFNKTIDDQKEATDNLTKSQKVYDEQVKSSGVTIESINKKDLENARLTDNAVGQDVYTEQEKKIIKVNKAINDYRGTINNAKKDGQDYLKQLNELGFKETDVQKLFNPEHVDPNKVVGNGNPNNDPAANKKAESERKAAEKKILDDRKQLEKELLKLQATMLIAGESETDKEVRATVEKYDGLKELAHGNADEIAKIEKAKYDAILQIQLKGEQASTDATIKDIEKREKIIRDGVDKFIENTSKLHIPTLVSDSVAADKLAQHQIDLMNFTGKKKLDLQKVDLQKQEDAEIQALRARGISTGTQENAIHEKFQRERDKLDTNYFAQQADKYLAFAQSAMGILDTINQAKTAQENAELERDKRANDAKKANLDKRLKDGLISQKQHDDEVKKLDDAYDKRQHELAVKQFKRNQRMQIAQAVMNGASAVVKILAETPKFDFGVMTAIEIGLAAATTAAEIAAIASAKPPEFGHGGLLNGPLHKQGGMGVYDQYGRKQAEMEGGEGIANRRTMGDPNTYQVTGTPSQIISRLNAMGGGVSWAGGATAVPAWSVQQPQQVNFSAVNASIGSVRRYYASGGVFDNPGSSEATSQSQDQLNNTLKFLTGAILSLQQQMQSPIKAYTVLTEHEATAKRLQDIRDDATMKG